MGSMTAKDITSVLRTGDHFEPKAGALAAGIVEALEAVRVAAEAWRNGEEYGYARLNHACDAARAALEEQGE